MTLKQFVLMSRKALVKHSPAIMLGAGIGLSLAAVITAVKATPKAVTLIDRKKEELEKDKLTVGETVKTTWKCYISTTLLFSASVACLICGNSVYARRNAALAAACTISENAFREYRESVAENVSKEVQEKINDTVKQKQLESVQNLSENEVTVVDAGGELFLDPISRRCIRTTINNINKAVNDLNHSMLCDGFGGVTSVNDFYDEIGFTHTDAGEVLGWCTSSGMIDISFKGGLTDQNKPCIVIFHNNPPTYDFNK